MVANKGRDCLRYRRLEYLKINRVDQLMRLWQRTPNVIAVLTSSHPCVHQALDEVLPSDKIRPNKGTRRKKERGERIGSARVLIKEHIQT